MEQTLTARALHPVRLTEIRIHGRGGQGNVVAAYILAQAAFEQGRFAQAFPSFGPERRGAPVSSYVRLADRAIQRHCQVRNPDFLIIQSQGLLHVAGLTAGLKPQGGILINSARDLPELEAEAADALESRNVIVLGADALATGILG